MRLAQALHPGPAHDKPRCTGKAPCVNSSPAAGGHRERHVHDGAVRRGAERHGPGFLCAEHGLVHALDIASKPVPEPSGLALAGIALGGVFATRRQPSCSRAKDIKRNDG
ncbi:PEP-CTERM sorting domain-containing protein [Azohydromonas australica]|uniref:PEP-CTERM sorting domain-containing protein n=1 Tax=Azohydromonas australica TaxID=364039 RepID=UPI0035BEE2F6